MQISDIIDNYEIEASVSARITVNYEMLIRILHSFQNRSINIIKDCHYSRNLIDSLII